ncbi:hypothetical protein [Nocardioides litoris]|uniref:hypothetical protein n=1 Tax=Nocardioides litoris TaxID=1926648 RepID=UPI001124A42A|nr:hypothetical protein [Nocardioides litoris]
MTTTAPRLRSGLVVGALLLSGLATGCSDDDFEAECKKLGGTVQTDRDKTTKRVNGKTKTSYKTDKDCVDDEGNEILDD